MAPSDVVQPQWCTGSGLIGHVMQGSSPCPSPSSAPNIVLSSMPSYAEALV